MIQILRLKNGEDIIGNVVTFSDDYEIQEPMSVSIEYRGNQSGLVMNHWLPVQLIKRNEITIKNIDVLCVLEPADEFTEYYMNTVEKIHDLLEARNLVDSLDDDEVNNIMDALDEQYGNTLH